MENSGVKGFREKYNLIMSRSPLDFSPLEADPVYQHLDEKARGCSGMFTTHYLTARNALRRREMPFEEYSTIAEDICQGIRMSENILEPTF